MAFRGIYRENMGPTCFGTAEEVHMHQALCYVWFAGAWNQGTWAGLGTALMSQTYPDTAGERTPWMTG